MKQSSHCVALVITHQLKSGCLPCTSVYRVCLEVASLKRCHVTWHEIAHSDACQHPVIIYDWHTTLRSLLIRVCICQVVMLTENVSIMTSRRRLTFKQTLFLNQQNCLTGSKQNAGAYDMHTTLSGHASDGTTETSWTIILSVTICACFCNVNTQEL